MIRLDGTTKYLARTGTVYSAPAGRGKQGDMFWAQTRPSADGKRPSRLSLPGLKPIPEGVAEEGVTKTTACDEFPAL